MQHFYFFHIQKKYIVTQALVGKMSEFWKSVFNRSYELYSYKNKGDFLDSIKSFALNNPWYDNVNPNLRIEVNKDETFTITEGLFFASSRNCCFNASLLEHNDGKTQINLIFGLIPSIRLALLFTILFVNAFIGYCIFC